MVKVTCANCGILITWKPTIVEGRFYCCVGCSQGGPCTCDYSHLPNPEDKAPIIIMEKEVIEDGKDSGH